MPKLWCDGKTVAVCVGCLVVAWVAQARERNVEKAHEPLVLHARVREPAKAGAGGVVRRQGESPGVGAGQTAIIICDMWNQHWCRGATRRVGELAPAMNRAVAAARAKGVLIIHSPSSCMDAYKGHPGPQTRTGRSQGRESPAHIGELVQEDPVRGEGNLSDRPVRRRLRRRAEVPAGLTLEIADRRHRDPATKTRSATRASRSGTCSKAGASPTSCSWASTRTCACWAGRSGSGSCPSRQERGAHPRPDRHDV